MAHCLVWQAVRLAGCDGHSSSASGIFQAATIFKTTDLKSCRRRRRVWCRHLKLGSSYEAALRDTLSRWGDVDTNEAIVGGLLGALHGAKELPDAWKRAVISRVVGSPSPISCTPGRSHDSRSSFSILQKENGSQYSSCAMVMLDRPVSILDCAS